MSTDKSVPQDEGQQADVSQPEVSHAEPSQPELAETTDSATGGASPIETPPTSDSSEVTAPPVETEQPETAPAAAVPTSAAERVTTEVSSEAPAADNVEATASSDEKPKMTLNPATTPEDARPVPSLGGELAVPAPVYGGPIELPSADDDEIEAEIAKAITGVGAEKTSEDFVSSEAADASGLPDKSTVDASIEAAIEEAMGGETTSTEGAEATSQQAADPDDLEPGQKLKGIVQSITGDNVFLDFAMRMSGVVPFKQFGSKEVPKPGEEIEVLFEKINEEEGLILTRRPGGAMTVQSADWDYLSKGQMVECVVKKTNKGGLEVTVGSLRGFIPASQIDLGFVEDMAVFVGRKLTAEITELKPSKKNLVLSRRKVLNARRADARKQLMEELKPDQVRTGTVKTIKDYGAFIDLGGTDGFLPISQISWIRIGHPSEVIAEGQEIEIKVLSIDREKNKISLGMRQLTQNPWRVAEDKYAKGSTITGRVTKTETFGAFVELEPGIEGLVHISELEHRRVKRVTEVLNTGDMIEVQVLEVDPAKKRISLSMKALQAKPEPVDRPKVEEEPVEKYVSKRKGPLKGGTGPAGGSGLFGNPGDFGK